MRFMILRHADAGTEAGAPASEELMAAMARYIEEMMQAGVWLGGDGLQPSARGKRVKFSRGRPRVIDGPFTEAKELIAGYGIIDVPSMDDAVAWMQRWPALDADGEVELEIRPFYELEELGSGPALEHHERLREQLAKR